MTATTAAASNGSTTTEAPAPASEPERLTGMARVRDTEVYHDASILRDAMSEADRLCESIYRAISDAYFKDIRRKADDADGRTAAEVADSPDVCGQAREALECLNAALGYVNRLTGTYPPPF